MGSFKLGKMTLRSLFSKPATVKYPYEQPKIYDAMRGHVVNDIDACILCGVCQRVCPVGAITVNRKGGTWEIDPYSCVQCASCVHECPKKCLSMDVHVSPATTNLTTFTMTKPVEEKPKKAADGAAKPVAKAKKQLTPEQEARVAAARERAAAKKAAAAAEAEKPAENAE